MFAINMIVGQLSGPIQQLYGFINSLQQAKIGMDRIGDVVLQKDETDNSLQLLTDIPEKEDVVLENRMRPVQPKISHDFGHVGHCVDECLGKGILRILRLRHEDDCINFVGEKLEHKFRPFDILYYTWMLVEYHESLELHFVLWL